MRNLANLNCLDFEAMPAKFEVASVVYEPASSVLSLEDAKSPFSGNWKRPVVEGNVESVETRSRWVNFEAAGKIAKVSARKLSRSAEAVL